MVKQKTNVFPISRELFADQRRERQRVIKREGGQAIENLSIWKRRIPMETGDRQTMARNMENILNSYKIRPSELIWNNDYATREEFARDLHRMRLPEDAFKERKLIAHTAPWLRLLSYVRECLKSRRESVSLEFLADKLTKGTRFHPTNTTADDDKIWYLLNGWANELDEKYGLLETYSQIAKAKAEYFRRNKIEIDKEWPNWLQPDFDHRPITLFNVDETLTDLYSMSLRHYQPHDWERLYGSLPKKWISQYQRKQDEIELWREQEAEASTLFYRSEASLNSDYAIMPRWFIGYIHGADMRYPGTKDWFAETGTLDPLKTGCKHGMHGYLVLYPNRQMSRIVPYIFSNQEEGSFALPLDDSKDYGEWYLQPKPENEVSVNQSFLVRVQESGKEIYESWEATAPDLINHPYLTWNQNLSKSIEDEIKALQKRTSGKRRIKNKRK